MIFNYKSHKFAYVPGVSLSIRLGLLALLLVSQDANALAKTPSTTEPSSCEQYCHDLWDPIIEQAQNWVNHVFNDVNASCCAAVGGVVVPNKLGPGVNSCAVPSGCGDQYMNCMKFNPALVAAQIELMHAQSGLAQCLRECEGETEDA